MATTTIKKETPANIGAYTKAETDAAIAEVRAFDFVDPIDISNSASGSNIYTCPRDGYIRFQNYDSTNGNASIKINGTEIYVAYASWFTGYSMWSCYVRKGMKINATITFTSFGFAFIGLT